MTSIAYRDGILAADSRATAGDHGWVKADEVQKIFRLPDGSLFAGAGDQGLHGALRAFLSEESGERPDIGDSDAIQVMLDGKIWYYTGKSVRVAKAPFIALGSGLPALLGAMYAGASAQEAVAIACKIDPYSGGFVYAVPIIQP